jgi:predicted DNA-binding antitoxin AbrB/MazE fold protein
MTGLNVEAVYEDGLLRLTRTLPLEDGATVTITIHPPGRGVKRGSGNIGWQGDPEVLRKIALDPEYGIEEAP